jgi:oxygen-independent coproporphyrinogen III oxidase
MSMPDQLQSDRQQPLSLYLHIPFCRHRCAYCDFNTYTSLGELKEEYAEALSREIGQVAGTVRRPVQTIFFGGGTPSLMSVESLGLVLQAVDDHFDLLQPAEITLEANPDTVDGPYLAALRRLGINRLSFGAQSAVAAELALLEREHDFTTVVEAMRLSRAAGFDNINLDLIYGLPGQSLEDWAYSLQAVLALAPEHLSLYCLIIEPGTPMQRWLDSGRIEPPDPDLAAEQYDMACQMLDQRGFNHYEISNWSRPGRECAHNLAYWRNQEYLGFGAGAHGHAAGYRYSVVRQPRVYIRRIGSGQLASYPISAAVAQRNLLGRAEAMADTVITQLRLLSEGLSLPAFAKHFGQSLYEAYPGLVESLTEWGLLVEVGDDLRLTRRGWFLSNQVFYRFMQPD